MLTKKLANLIIVGGSVAIGKSTLVNGISKRTGWTPIQEINEDDPLQNTILTQMYEGKRLHLATVQYFFITTRLKVYKENSNSMITSILDRGLWEDDIFAKLLMVNEPKSYKHFRVFWESVIKSTVEKYGCPKAYIFVTADWETFKERIFNRHRDAEIHNFESNKEYFKNLLNEYNNHFEETLRGFGIKPIKIDTINKTPEEVLNEAMIGLKSCSCL